MMDVTAFGRSLLASAAATDARNILDTAPYVDTRTELKAIDTTKETVAFLKEARREGLFIWQTGNFSVSIAADTAEGVYIKATAIASSAGAWVRVFAGPADVRWFGVVGDNATDNITAIEAMLGSGVRAFNWGGTANIYRVTRTINVSLANTAFFGQATIKLDRAGLAIQPLMNVLSTATSFFSEETLVYDHNALGIAQPTLANQPAFAICVAVLLQPSGFNFSGKVINSWDCGIAVGQIAFTGNGIGTPYTATQSPGFPQSWHIGYVHGEGCGVGVHDGSFGEVGKKGSVLVVLTGSDGVIESVTGKANYGGLIIDFAGGGEASIGETAFTGTLLDAANPNNGSGIDHYFGSGQITAAALKSDNAGRLGLAISPDAGTINVNARIHASGKQGARIEGGRVSGVISVSDASVSSSGAFDAIEISAGTADVWLNILATVTGPVGGPTHRYSYKSAVSGGFKVIGSVELVSQSAVTGPYSRGGKETLKYSAEGVNAIFGAVGLGMLPLDGTTSGAFVNGSASLSGNVAGTFFNLYFDNVSGQWKYLGNGYGAVLKLESTGGMGLYVAPNNVSGAGAVAAVTQISTFGVNGDFGLVGGAWNTGHTVMGAYHLWMDAFGLLRFKSGAPSSSQDGSVVGAGTGDITGAVSGASLASITDPVNTTNKRLGKVMWNSSVGAAFRARGSTAGDIWDSLGETGSTITPV
jgi:hypothetical protein